MKYHSKVGLAIEVGCQTRHIVHILFIELQCICVEEVAGCFLVLSCLLSSHGWPFPLHHHCQTDHRPFRFNCSPQNVCLVHLGWTETYQCLVCL